MARRKGKKRSGSRAISINLAKTAAVGYTAFKLLDGVSLSGGISSLGQVGENFKANWKDVLGLSLGVAVMGMVAGRYAPRVGIKNALSVKAF